MTTQRQDSNYMDLCKFVFADGRMCAMPGLPSFNGYCRSHASHGRPKPFSEENLIAEVLQFVDPQTGHINVHGALEQVFRAMAANKISTRRAATFGYLGQLILLSDPAKTSKQKHMREVHDLYNMTSNALRAIYLRRSNPAQSAPTPRATNDSSPSPRSEARPRTASATSSQGPSPRRQQMEAAGD
jgi:hypothetical protein